MGSLVKPEPVKLIAGFIYKDEGSLERTQGILCRYFGSIDHQSRPIDFSSTGYYPREMGAGLKKRFVSFSRLIRQDSLARIKILTNKIEKRLSCKGCRTVNIDPGYLTSAKLVLASTKDYSHRIYLEKGIFAEITLSFRGKSFLPLDWTYPDYRTAEYIEVFNKIREIYTQQLRK